MSDYFTAALLIVGSIFILLASLGVAKMPDIFSRMHATTKAATLGASLMMLAVAVFFAELGTVVRSLAVIFFVFFTAPVSAHMIGSAAYLTGIPLWKGTVDENKDSKEPEV